MKYYSEKLNEVFDSIEALQEAESKTKKKKDTKKPDATVAKSAEVTSPSKKELAAAVEAADDKVKEAYANYEAAQARVEELSKEYLALVDDILTPAKKAVKEAEQNRYDAISKFNDSFGAYQVTYTGAKAADELFKAISNINLRDNKFYRDFFWF